ncbi:MAG: hypothetical protein AB4206_06580 [Xenococcaceae cyanobacterium]
MNQQESTMMTAEKTKLQKLQTLLNSATNERQRKMYLALLNKAKAELASESASPQQKTTESSQKKTQTSTNKKTRGKTAKKKAKSLPPTSKQTSSKKKATSKKEKASNNNSVVVTEEISATNKLTSVLQTEENKKSATTKTKAKALKQSQQSEKSKSNNDKAGEGPASDSDKKVYFSGVGIIKCTPYLEDEKIFITINEQQCALKQAVGTERTRISLLKEELESNGSREMLLRVYPNITHHSDGSPPSHSFRLVQFYLDEEQYSELPEEFIFRGVWRVVSHCPSPVITIYRNINRYAFYKRLSKYAKQYFVKAQDFPLVWNAPVEPYEHYPARDKSEQMPCYFVQVKAIFKNGQYIVTEMLSEPTLDIPRFIEPKRIFSSQNKSKQSDRPNQLNKESDSNTEVTEVV